MRLPAGILTLAAILGCVAIAPAAHAQVPSLPGTASTDAKITMEIQDPGAAMVPARPYAMTVTVHYQYSQGGNNAAGDPCADLTVPNPPPWASIEIAPSRICFPINPTFAVSGTTVTNTSIATMNLTDAAPALEPYDLTVVAHAPAIGPFREATGQGVRPVQAGFVGKVELQAPGNLTIRGGAPQTVPLTFVNKGNGPMMVRFRNISAPQGLRVEPPANFTLEKPGDQRTVDVVVMAPWSTQVRGLLDIGADTIHPSRTDLAGDTARAKVNVEAKAAVPGFEAALLLVGVVLATFVRRRD